MVLRTRTDHVPSVVAYAIFYLWFEAFPLVFIDIYHFNLGVSGLPFLGLMVGTVIAYIFYAGVFYFILEPKMMRSGPPAPEAFLHLALATSIFIPTSLFIFGMSFRFLPFHAIYLPSALITGWTSRDSVHWIVPIIGAAIYMPGIYILFQCALVYLPVSYPKYQASILAGNDFFPLDVCISIPSVRSTVLPSVGIGRRVVFPCWACDLDDSSPLRAHQKWRKTPGPLAVCLCLDAVHGLHLLDPSRSDTQSNYNLYFHVLFDILPENKCILIHCIKQMFIFLFQFNTTPVPRNHILL